MGKTGETKEMRAFLNALQSFGYFRNITDQFQVGIPDIIGSYKGAFIGIEFKSVDELSGTIPPKGSHPFTSKQVRELGSIEKSEGVGVGVIRCGKKFVLVLPLFIKDGRVDFNSIPKEYIFDTTTEGVRKFLEAITSTV